MLVFLFQVNDDVGESPVLICTNVSTPEGNSAATPVGRLLWNNVTPVTSPFDCDTTTSVTCKEVANGSGTYLPLNCSQVVVIVILYQKKIQSF